VLLDNSSSVLELSRVPRDYWQWTEALSVLDSDSAGSHVRFEMMMLCLTADGWFVGGDDLTGTLQVL